MPSTGGFDRQTVFVGEISANNDNEVYDRLDAKTSKGKKHEDAGADFAHVEAVNAEEPKEEAE